MYLRALTLRNFRSYENAQFQFSPKINVIRGLNARGKTTLLEAIFFLMTGRSFRTAQPSALIRHGASFFQLEALFIKYGIEQNLRIYFNGKERKIFYNETSTHPLTLLGLLQGVIMYPEDIDVIKGPPAARRRVLNLQLAQSDPLYIHYLTRYEQAMRQRNALLRAQSNSAIESWEYEMGNAAAYIIGKRAGIVNELETLGKNYYAHICGGGEEFSLLYRPNGALEHSLEDLQALRNLFCEQYRKHRKKEMLLGLTLTGPHKDDMIISLEKKEARIFASEGQKRSCVAALRLGEWMQLKGASQEMPLMLIDDFGLSLDSFRRSSLLAHLESLEQLFISTIDKEKYSSEENSINL
jgi:DNA replication and repair protein RecF